MTEVMYKTYLGDGAYASFDGYNVWLTTEDGARTTNAVALEPKVLENLLDLIKVWTADKKIHCGIDFTDSDKEE